MPDPSPGAPSRGSRLNSVGRGPVLPVLGLLVALVAVGLAVWALVRTMPSQPEFTADQRAQAKTKVCAAYDTVRKGVTLNTTMPNPGGGTDVTGAMVIAANARVSLYDGGQYLLARIDPATPSELADPARTFGNLLMDIGAASTAGVQNDDPDQAARLHDADTLSATIEGQCQS